MTQSIYIPRGVNTDALSRSVMWDYEPQGFKVRISFILQWFSNKQYNLFSQCSELVVEHKDFIFTIVFLLVFHFLNKKLLVF